MAMQQSFENYGDTITQNEFDTDDNLKAETQEQADIDVFKKIEEGDGVAWSGVGSPDTPGEATDVSEAAAKIEIGDEQYKVFPDPRMDGNIVFSGPSGEWTPVRDLWLVSKAEE